MRAQQIARVVGALQLVLIFPAALFMTAVVARNLQPLQERAQGIVMLYAGRVWTLWVLLLALPLCVLVTGCATLLHGWNGDVELPNTVRPSFLAYRPPSATLFVAATTLAAAGILAIVILHMLAN